MGLFTSSPRKPKRSSLKRLAIVAPIYALAGGLAGIVGLMVVSAVVGFVIAIAIFFALFLHVNARAPLGRNAILTAAAVLFLAAMSYVFVLDFPGGYLQEAVEMPWPLK